MNIVDKVIDTVLQHPQYKLVGGQSIIRSIPNGEKWVARETSDVDIRICSELHERNVEHLTQVLQHAGFQTDVRVTRSGNFKIYLTDVQTGEKVRMDTEWKPGDEIESKIRNLRESLYEKFMICMMSDRIRFKNVVDVVLCLQLEYPSGISKGELLHVLSETGVSIRYVDLDELLVESYKFKPQVLNGVSMQEVGTRFHMLVSGLMNDHLDDDAIFMNGEWLQT